MLSVIRTQPAGGSVMPTRPKTICATAGCPRLVAAPDRYCTTHKRTRAHTTEQRKLYNSGLWQRVRGIVRRKHPICQKCGKSPSQTVHHINGIITDLRLENLEAQCWPCHNSTSGKEHRAKQMPQAGGQMKILPLRPTPPCEFSSRKTSPKGKRDRGQEGPDAA